MLAEWSFFEVEMIQAIHQLPATSSVPSKPFFSPQSVLGRILRESVTPQFEHYEGLFFFPGKICRKQWWNHGFHHWISYIDIINIIIYHYIMYHREPGNSKVSLFFCFNNFWENMVVLDTTPRRQSNTDTKEFDILILTMWQCHSLGTHMARWFWLSSASTVVTVRSRIPNQPTMAAEHHPFLMATNISIFWGISPCKNW